jgi:hypothetical protein
VDRLESRERRVTTRATVRVRGFEETSMKAGLNIAGVCLILAGVVWFLQGINILPGSFMTGDLKWAVIGGICAVAGAGCLIAAKRRSKP